MPLFHEKQRYMRCGIHAINNLLQRKEFDVASFDAICRELSPESSWQHQSILGLGNYNVDILTMALMKQGFTLSYFDKRKPLALLDLQATTGILCNAASVSLMGLWHSRHWFAIRSIYGVYYNLDSKLPEPKPFSDKDAVLAFLHELMTTDSDFTLLIVTPSEPSKQEEASLH